MREQKKYCIWDKKFDLCKTVSQRSTIELRKICEQLNRTTPNRYELREVKCQANLIPKQQ